MPGRLLVGEFPGSRSRAGHDGPAQAGARGRHQQFIDLTDRDEPPAYEALLPLRRRRAAASQYMREPIPDHGVPGSHDTMERIVGELDDALEAGQVVYLHCRAGIGRSAMVAGCWLVEAGHERAAALEALQRCWKQTRKSQHWVWCPRPKSSRLRPRVGSAPGHDSAVAAAAAPCNAILRRFDARSRGALFGLARRRHAGLRIARPATRATRLDAAHRARALRRGQPARRAALRREGPDGAFPALAARRLLAAAEGRRGSPRDDVTRALATYRWRGSPWRAHTIRRDRAAAEPVARDAGRALCRDDPAAAVALAGECSRTTHQSPVVLDACRYLAAMFVGALQRRTASPSRPSLRAERRAVDSSRPLKREVAAMAATAVPLADSSAAIRNGVDVCGRSPMRAAC